MCIHGQMVDHDRTPKKTNMQSKVKQFSAVAVALFGLGALSACHTIEGAGQDIEAAGDKIEETAEDNRSY